MRRVNDYQLLDHFNTRGTIPLGFADVASGVGKSPAEAVQAALDRLTERGWDVNGLSEQILADRTWPSSDSSYFVSLHVW
jgi:hypothetical protein